MLVDFNKINHWILGSEIGSYNILPDIALLYFIFCRISQDNIPKVGSLVSGVVVRLDSLGIVIKLTSENDIKGTVFNEHLADFQGCFLILNLIIAMMMS